MKEILEKLGIAGEQQGAGTGSSRMECDGEILESVSPVNGQVIGKIRCARKGDYGQIVESSMRAFREWRMVPAPRRGEIVRQIGNALRARKKNLGELVSLEVGKIRVEGEGEVQEMIDIADFAVGQSRMLYGLTMHSERSEHRMYEQWHPMGPIGVITAFNFPVAVWAWNAMVGLIAGDTIVWKPSSKAPLAAIATMKIAWQVLKENGLPEGILSLVVGNRDQIGEPMIRDRRIPLISATGSVRMGKRIGEVVGERLGRTILELGGNNAIIVTRDADLDMAVRAIVFGAVGTAGQRCTTTRRIIVHEDVCDTLTDRLVKAYKQVKIGNPLEEDILMGPLIDREAVETMQAALKEIQNQQGRVLCGGEVLSGGIYDAGTYVRPCICEIGPHAPIVREETFAPILYIIRYKTPEDAIKYHNDVPQGLSSAIFTKDIQEAETFLSHRGSDCGIANVNIGTSGAEIGGAFGGEKETGGGRESGSDAWKAYMRRQTCTINWSKEMPLAQGIRFEVD
ncbi:aldehyde dehydrogenase family protein [Desulfococcaceae bacterium HSG8]|nr:aldehyde dehydrogenase family protein [Desulfococcaceae bacterium HSG8]